MAALAVALVMGAEPREACLDMAGLNAKKRASYQYLGQTAQLYAHIQNQSSVEPTQD